VLQAPPITPLPLAPTLLVVSLVVGAAFIGLAVCLAARWGARTARTARAVAEAAGQLVVIRPIGGGDCTPICVPPPLAYLFTTPVVHGATLPPWRPDVLAAIEALSERVMVAPSQSATLEADAADHRLRLVGARISDGEQILVAVSEAGPDVARVNRIESAALLSSGVVHDLLNVLNTLVLHAEVGYERAVAPVARTHFDRIRTAGGRAADLASLMRRYLRGEAAVVALEEVRVSAIVQEIVELLRPSIPRSLELTLALVDDSAVLAEPVHVHQVVLNLLVNALQALEGRPAPRITVRVTCEGDPRTVELTISDNGPGLPASVRERCFEPFFTTKQGRGTGLGLAVVRSLVEDTLRGRVQADDAPGGGARFVVRIPAAPSSARPSEDRRGAFAQLPTLPTAAPAPVTPAS
jgi:signal transduction histidine kinase